MTKAWAKARTKQRRAEAVQRAEEQKEHAVLVSTSTPFPISAVLAVSSDWSQEPLRGQYGLHPTHPMRDASGLLPLEDEDPITVVAVAAVHSDSASTPRDFSVLRSASAHPWRTIRQRNHRLLPQRRERPADRPFPRSLPRRTIISAPRADVLALHDHIPILPPLPPSIADVPSPPLPPSVSEHTSPLPVPAPSFPASTSYGPVRSGLALACATEKACLEAVTQVFDVVWGPYATDTQKNFLVELPGDQLVFLCMLAEFAVLEPVFMEFLHPAIANFSRGWVTHCLQDSSGYG